MGRNQICIFLSVQNQALQLFSGYSCNPANIFFKYLGLLLKQKRAIKEDGLERFFFNGKNTPSDSKWPNSLVKALINDLSAAAESEG